LGIRQQGRQTAPPTLVLTAPLVSGVFHWLFMDQLGPFALPLPEAVQNIQQESGWVPGWGCDGAPV
jgi:hypothetical protein